MAGFLFDKVVFGPVSSRRLGKSLGINLLPTTLKVCSFNCIYCECGWTKQEGLGSKLPTKEELAAALEEKLIFMNKEGGPPDTITFAGNGEPTLHPHFAEIIDITINLRDKYSPHAQVVVLSNGTMLDKPDVFEALKRVDMNIQKLDAGTQEMLNLINRPKKHHDIDHLVDKLQEFDGKVIVQTLFLKGVVDGIEIDNTTEEELELWLARLKKISPEYVMVYPIDRETPVSGIAKTDNETLTKIAKRVKGIGIDVKVYN